MSRNFLTTGTPIQLNTSPITKYPFTISAWLYRSSGFGSLRDYVISTAAGATRMGLAVQGTGEPRFVVGNTNITATSAIGTDTWFHVVAVASSATSRALWVNGVKDGTSTTSVAYVAQTTFTIGGTSAGVAIGGRVAEVATWDRVLADDEIIALSKGFPANRFMQDITLYMPLIRDIVDHVGIADLSAKVDGDSTVQIHPRRFG